MLCKENKESSSPGCRSIPRTLTFKLKYFMVGNFQNLTFFPKRKIPPQIDKITAIGSKSRLELLRMLLSRELNKGHGTELLVRQKCHRAGLQPTELHFCAADFQDFIIKHSLEVLPLSETPEKTEIKYQKIHLLLPS